MRQVPRVFISYSHDSENHKAWVLNLSTRLRANGVDVVLDQWDVKLGGDIAKFIEEGLSESVRIIMICTEHYVEKADSGKGGVGYEKMIMTAELMRDLDSNKIIPLIRNNNTQKTPTFIGERRYIDFNSDKEFEEKYEELIRDIHGAPSSPKPSLGVNPFIKSEQPEIKPLKLQSGSERYVSASLKGKVTFDYSNNNGNYIIGAGDLAFETNWSKAGDTSIYTTKDRPSIAGIGLALDVKEISEISDATRYDMSSMYRTPREGEIVVARNQNGYYAALKVLDVKDRTRADNKDELTFEYVILSNRTADFSVGGGDTYNIIDSHASFGDNTQHAGRDIITPEPKKQKAGPKDKGDLTETEQEKKITYTGEEASKKLADKMLKYFRPTIPNQPFSDKPIRFLAKEYKPPKDYREILTKQEIEQLKQAVPNLSDAGIEAVLRKVYNMGDERTKKLTWKEIFVFCEEYVNNQNKTEFKQNSTETGQGNKGTKREREGFLEPKPPETLAKILWIWKHGRQHWKLVCVGILVLLISGMFALPKFNLFGNKYQGAHLETENTLHKPIVVASATVEVKITSDWDFNGRVANTKAHLAFVKGDKPLLITSSIGYTASQTGNDEVVYKAKLDMDAKDSAVGNPVSYLRDAEYVQIEFGRMPSDSDVLGGDVICIINNSVRLEFSIPPQKLVNNRIFIRNLSQSLRVLNELGN